MEVVSPDLLKVIEVCTNLLLGIPGVGPVLVKVFAWLGLISAILTALSMVTQMVLALPEIAARYAGAPALADKIKYWSDRIIYVLKYLSVFNAKKPPTQLLK